MKHNPKIKNGIQILRFYYHIYIPLLITFFIVYICKKYKIYIWKATNYSDMLTAVITFLSIIISVYGILIPTVFMNKEDNNLISFFVKNADIKYFVQNIKRVMISGIVDILFICALYCHDVFPKAFYYAIAIASLYTLLFFLCGSYRYLSIMLRLIMENITPYKGKKYKNHVSTEQQNKINKMLRKKYEE